MHRSFINFQNGNVSRRRNLVEFRAGKMMVEGKLVSPIKERKGLVYLKQTDDSLIHFCWKDRESGQVDDDFVLFPNQAQFKRVNQCNTGRVYVLIFKETSMRHFYWMQEPKQDKDEEYERKINYYINNPPVSGHQTVDDDTSSIATQHRSLDDNIQELESQANILMALSQALNEVLKQNPHIDPEETHREPHTFTLNDLQNAINSANNSNRTEQQVVEKVEIDLCSSLTTESLTHLQTNQNFMNKITDNVMLPSDSKGKSDDFLSTIQSPQFQSSLRGFSKAFQTCHLTDLIRQFGLSQQCIDAANSGDFTRFAQQLQNSFNNNESHKNNKKKL